jgi:UDP-glucose 4-epimerase
MKHILVTGGAGFIGTNLVKRLKTDGHAVVVLDNYIAGKHDNEIEGVTYINDETRNIDSITLPFKPDVVFHLGEYSRIHPSFKEYETVWRCNTLGTFEIINYCSKNNIKIVYAGSSTKFAWEGVDHSPYSLTKSMSLELVKAFSKWYGLKYSICYFYNVFGPGHNSSPVKGFESVISVFEQQYLNKQAITVSGTGDQERMFTYVGDIVDGLIRSWHYEHNEEFELGNPKLYKIIDIAKMFSDNIVFVEARKGDRNGSVITEPNRTKDLLGWEPTIDVDHWIQDFKTKCK